jgi:hypothetical protein
MKIKFRSIELFGVSGSGKSFLRNKIKKILIDKGYKIFDTREIIIICIGKVLKLNFHEKIIIFYFAFLLKFNIKTTLWNKTLLKICKKFLHEEQKKYLFLKKKIKIIFIKNNKKLFNYNYLWFEELIIAKLIFEKLKRINNKFIYFPDEGFAQKFYLHNYIKQKTKKYSNKKYIKNEILCDLVVNVKCPKSRIMKVHKIRSQKNNGWILNKKEINIMLKKEKNIINKRYFTFEIIINNKSIKEQINNLILR